MKKILTLLLIAFLAGCGNTNTASKTLDSNSAADIGSGDSAQTDTFADTQQSFPDLADSSTQSDATSDVADESEVDPTPDASANDADASSKPSYKLAFNALALRTSSNNGKFFVFGNEGIIRVNPTPAPHPGWTPIVTALLTNKDLGDLTTSVTVPLNGDLIGHFTMLASGGFSQVVTLSFKLQVLDDTDTVVAEDELLGPSLTLPNMATKLKGFAISDVPSDTALYVSPSDGKEVTLAAPAKMLDTHDSLAVTNLSIGYQTVLVQPSDGANIEGKVPGLEGHLLVLFTFASSTNENSSTFQEHTIVAAP